jgi:hypothetical protein
LLTPADVERATKYKVHLTDNSASGPISELNFALEDGNQLLMCLTLEMKPRLSQEQLQALAKIIISRL